MNEYLNQMPPQNIELELSILATVIQYPEDNLFELSESDFYRTGHGEIYKQAKKLFHERKPVNITTVATELTQAKKIEEIGGGSYLSKILDEPILVDNEYSINQLKGYADLRRMIQVCHTVTKKCFSGSPDEVNGIIDNLQRDSMKIGVSNNGNLCSMSELSIELIEHCEQLAKNKGLTGIPSGYERLDSLLSGFQDSDLIILAGRPSMGKTAFAVNCMRNAALHGNSSDFYSLEMSRLQVAKRFLAVESRLNSQKLRNGNLSSDDWMSITNAATNLHSYPINIDDTPVSNYSDIQRKARKSKKENNTDIIWIDYLSFIQGDKGLSVVKEIETITRGLKSLAKELNIPIVLLCQLNRLCEQRPNKRPVLSDLRDSGAIEQDADVVLFLYRDEVYDEEKNPGVAEVKIAKHRNGPTGTIKLVWRKKSTRFENLAIESKP